MSRSSRAPRSPLSVGEPFESPAEAWFWAMACHQAKLEGARVRSGLGLVSRPCEANDIFRWIDRLYRQRRLVGDHLRVLAHYGRRAMAPDPARPAECRAAGLWDEALERLGCLLRARGVVV